MRNPFVHGVGGILSADIAVPEHEREVRFYAQILTTGSDPLWRDDLINNRGIPIIGLGARVPEYEALPLQWMPHIQVRDVGASVSRALEHGGTEIMHGKDDAGQSQWAVLTDPAGAGFGLVSVVGDEWELGDQPESAGRIAALSLCVPDVASTCAFYEQVIGWSPARSDIDGEFEMRRPDGGSSATVREARDENKGVPPVWILTLPVGDLDESLRRAHEGGGEIIKGSADIGHAIVRDPVGVCIALQAG